MAEPARLRGGRIGGIYSPHVEAPPDALEGMRRALGPDALLLEGTSVVADADACWLDGEPVVDFAAAVERLDELDGSFALAWRTPQGRLRLTADAVGHRTLYYARGERNSVVFASTLHGVLGSGLVARKLCEAAVPLYLSFAYVPGPRTLVEGVYALPPGHVLEAGMHTFTITPWFRLPGEPAGWEDEDVLRAELRRSLERAIERVLPPASAPLGATLSGGIDSSLVLALARRRHEGPITSYSVSFGPEHANELSWSGLVAQHTGVPQVVVEVRPEDIVRELDATVCALSEPNGDPLTVPNTLLFRRAAAETGVVLNGEGGDPCFGGPKNAPMLLGELLEGADERHARARRYLRAHQKCYDELPELLSPRLCPLLATCEAEELVTRWFEDARWSSLLDKLMAINVTFKGAHHILPKVDHLSFLTRSCARSPLFDRRIVELSFRIAPAQKRRGAVEKHLLKEAVRDVLPQSVVDRPKSGMMVPVEAWFKGPLKAFAQERLLEGLATTGLVEKRFLEDLLDARNQGLRPRRGVKIWLLLTLESWLRGMLTARQGS